MDPIRGWRAGCRRSRQRCSASAPRCNRHRRGAYQLLSLKLQQQAALLAYDKIYLTMGIAFTCALPLLLLFRTGRVTGKVDAH